MIIAIDDMRDHVGADIVCRNIDAARFVFMAFHGKGAWDLLLLDHDLGGRETGMDFLKWGHRFGMLPPEIVLVTDNPVGRKNMEAFLENDAGYHRKLGSNVYVKG